MTSIQRPTGPGGPSGPGGVDGADGPEGPDGPEDAGAVEGGSEAGRAGEVRLQALAATLGPGRRAAVEAAMAELVDGAVEGLEPAAAEELRAMMTELLAHDPYLAGLAQALGRAPEVEE